MQREQQPTAEEKNDSENNQHIGRNLEFPM
jgi:hypothetical protein